MYGKWFLALKFNAPMNWKRKKRQARSLLVQLVSEEFKGTIGIHESSADAWNILQDTLGGKNVTSVIIAINNIFDMKKEPSKSWQEHIIVFEALWNIVAFELSTANAADKFWKQGFRIAFMDKELKAQLLLHTLPSELDKVVYNLRTKTDLRYYDVRTRILDLSSNGFFPASSALNL
ncbi:hypothetical protein BGX38DRAFT_1145243 [Terfezia claveryi]|nr:hypothetical protein BGX38DRAFT_1309484 [Terfezia claveryi]KAF8437328.1 hypothetical protein BGX38DRAFT_1145243 [Terfezia claveryi]